MLRKFLLTTSVLISTVSFAQAADIEPVAAFDWTGFYVGAHVGYGDPSFDGVFDTGESDDEERSFADDINADGILGGLQAGYNYQIDNIVLGIEADISFTDFSGDTEDDEPDEEDGIKADVDFLASLRARAGFAVDNVLLYATGGVAYADGEFEFKDEGDDAGSVDIDDFGYVVGGGIEWAATEQTSLRLEGLYYGFGKERDLDDIDDGDEDDFIELKDVIVVRAGANWRF